MRNISSCTTCRARKKKCVAPSPGSACTLCTAKNLPCNLKKTPPPISAANESDRHYVELRSSATLLPIPLHEATAVSPRNGEQFLASAVCDELINLYFDLFHNTQHIIFHRWSFLADKAAGSLPDYLLWAIAALMARFSTNVCFDNVAPGERGATYLKQALAGFYARSELSSTHALQGCVLLSFTCFVEDCLHQSSLLSAQAIRMAQLLELPGKPIEDELRREIDIRLYWQVHMMDAWDTARDNLPRQLIAKPHTPLPLAEEIFEDLRPNIRSEGVESSLSQQRHLGIWAQVTSLTDIFAAVVKTIFVYAEQPSVIFGMEGKIEALTMQLDHWLDSLPPDLYNTAENFNRAASRGNGRTFAVLHLIYHHQCQLLYFRYLGRCLTEDAGAFSRQCFEYAARCKAHAGALSELMWRTNTTGGMECLWSPVNGHLLVVASSIHLFTLLTDQDPEKIAQVRTLLERNFVMLVQFQKYWPTLRVSLSRLRAFQKACLRHKLAVCFEMDNWMVKFLLSYQSMISERFPLDEDQDTPGSANLDPNMIWPSIIEDDLERSHLDAALSFA